MKTQQMPAPQIFEHEEFGNVRVIIVDNEPHFCLSDVCKILDLRIDGVVMRLKDDPSNTGVVDEVLIKYPIQDRIGRMQEMYFVNEDGLYDTILDSRKPEAKRFRKWITREVLPSLRKYGYYALPSQNKTNDNYFTTEEVECLFKIMEIFGKHSLLCFDMQKVNKELYKSQLESIKLMDERNRLRKELQE